MRKRVDRRIIFLAAGLIAMILVAFAVWWFLQATQSPKEVASVPTEPVTEAHQDPRLSFVAMGDMLAHDTIVANAKTDAGYDFTKYFEKIRKYYRDKDVVFCNPETPAAASFPVSGYPTFNAPIEFTRDLRSEGCNLINLATNHIYDKGVSGVSQTIEGWEAEKPLAVAGANRIPDEQQKVRYFEKNGIKVAFLAYADFSNAGGYELHVLNIYHDEALLRQQVMEASSQADLVVVSMHWGTEDSEVVNADQEKMANMLSELGVDVVIGTGPHVLQKVSWLTNVSGGRMLVWYSIGNMLSSQLGVNQLTGGVAGFDAVKKSDKISIENISFAPTFMAYDWLPADRASNNLLARNQPIIYPLADAEAKLVEMFPDRSVRERQDYVRNILGQDVQLTIN